MKDFILILILGTIIASFMIYITSLLPSKHNNKMSRIICDSDFSTQWSKYAEIKEGGLIVWKHNNKVKFRKMKPSEICIQEKKEYIDKLSIIEDEQLKRNAILKDLE